MNNDRCKHGIRYPHECKDCIWEDLKNVGIYPGSFDPITVGHLDLIQRAAKLFDKLYIGIGSNGGKKPFLNYSDRIHLIEKSCHDIINIEVVYFDGLLVDYCKPRKIKTIVRGLRAVSDFESELSMAHVNRKLYPDIDTMFLATDTDTSFVSSSMVREVFRLGGDISQFVPKEVNDYLISNKHVLLKYT
jgi:pantetheine-phosphate adenylyltransferase